MYLVEASYVFGGRQVRLPYSTGLLWSHCQTNDTIKTNYELTDILFVRDEIETFIDSIENPSVVGFSCFVWNWAFNNEVAEKVKQRYPDCVIVYGGQHQPSADRLKHETDFFVKHPYVDILVHGEGELTFENILLENLEEKDWSKVSGITYKKEDNTFVTNPTRLRIGDIDKMPSPYLNGLMDRFVDKWKHKYVFTATIESVRGCPYRCTYCEIGDLYFQKIRPQSYEKIEAEFTWMSKNKVEYVDNADSNFGLYFDRDYKIAELLVKLKEKYGFPMVFRNDWAKDRGIKLIPIAQKLKDGDMAKGLTMALQSFNPATLKAIMRKNIVNDDIQEFIDKCNEINLPIYAELIVGLPEETLDSFKDGIFKLINFGLHNYVGIYPLSILPNTPFGDPDYIDKYKIKYTKTKALYYHITETEIDESEEEDIAIETATMTFDELLQAHEFRWFIMITHFFGLTQFISRFVKNHSNIGYEVFYTKLHEQFSENTDSVLGKEIADFKVALKDVFTNNRYWGWYLEDNRTWEFDEGSIVKIWKQVDKFYDEIKQFLLDNNFVENEKILDTALYFQKHAIINPDKKYPYKLKLPYNIHEVINQNKPLANGGYELSVDSNAGKNYRGDYIKWCRDLFWWGRKEGRYKSIMENKSDIQKTSMG